MNKISKHQQIQAYVTLLQQGNERGLNFFYHRFYEYLFFRTKRATQDECAAKSIVQEALLRLWLFRKQVKDVEDILSFLKTQIKVAIQVFYQKSQHKFNRSLLRLDEIQNYQEFLLGYDLEEDTDVDLIYLEKLEQEKEQRLNQINSLLPSLNEKQQMFIRLCLKYSFNYGRIAYYLGGISDYEVSLQVEKTIENLRSIFTSSQKMDFIGRSSKITIHGEFDDQQSQIFHMRYEMQMSFDQIADSLHLNGAMVKKLFIEAHAKIKTHKKSS